MWENVEKEIENRAKKTSRTLSVFIKPLHVSSVTPSHALTLHLTEANCNIMQTEQC